MAGLGSDNGGGTRDDDGGGGFERRRRGRRWCGKRWWATASVWDGGARDGNGGSLPPKLFLRSPFVFFIWIEMEKARGGARVYIAQDP
jgi:hypothetical protein